MNFKGSQFEREIILWAVRWYVAYDVVELQINHSGKFLFLRFHGSSTSQMR